MLNKDYKDMLSALNEAGVEYLVVGAFAMAAHDTPRATVDIDIWVRPSKENSQKVWKAIVEFGAPHSGVSVDDFSTPDTIFQIGVAPRRIDILTSISGVEFEEAWVNRMHSTMEALQVPVLGFAELIANKRASGRPKDLVDADWLEERRGKN